jgi:periplasmic protein CpxP/Spy
MKKLVVIAIALASLQAIAQNHKAEQRKGERKENVYKLNDFSPEQIATLKTKKMTLHLDLTEAQQRDIQKINVANAKERKAKMEARKKMRKSGTTVKPSTEERFNMMNERLDKQIAYKKQIQAILSKEQFEKFKKGSKHKQMKQRKQNKQRSKRS